jgi:hypothetical protein
VPVSGTQFPVPEIERVIMHIEDAFELDSIGRMFRREFVQ